MGLKKFNRVQTRMSYPPVDTGPVGVAPSARAAAAPTFSPSVPPPLTGWNAAPAYVPPVVPGVNSWAHSTSSVTSPSPTSWGTSSPGALATPAWSNAPPALTPTWSSSTFPAHPSGTAPSRSEASPAYPVFGGPSEPRGQTGFRSAPCGMGWANPLPLSPLAPTHANTLPRATVASGWAGAVVSPSVPTLSPLGWGQVQPAGGTPGLMVAPIVHQPTPVWTTNGPSPTAPTAFANEPPPDSERAANSGWLDASTSAPLPRLSPGLSPRLSPACGPPPVPSPNFLLASTSVPSPTRLPSPILSPTPQVDNWRAAAPFYSSLYPSAAAGSWASSLTPEPILPVPGPSHRRDLTTIYNEMMTTRRPATVIPVQLNDGFVLKAHQTEIADFMLARENDAGTVHEDGTSRTAPVRGGIVGAAMGVGKTLSTLYHVARTRDPVMGPTLVVCQPLVMVSWKTDIEQAFGQHTRLSALFLHGSTPEGVRLMANLTVHDLLAYDLVVITYDALSRAAKVDTVVRDHNLPVTLPPAESRAVVLGMKNGKRVPVGVRRGTPADIGPLPGEGDIISPYYFPQNSYGDPSQPARVGLGLLVNFYWRRVVFDEIQQLANYKNLGFRAGMCVPAFAVLGLSGTVIRNCMQDLGSALALAGAPHVFPKTFRLSAQFKHDPILVAMYKTVTREDAQLNLPPVDIQMVRARLNEEERRVYLFYFYELWDRYDRFMRADKNEADKDYSEIMALFTRLRQTAISPWIITDEAKNYPGSTSGHAGPPRPTALSTSRVSHVRDLEHLIHVKELMGYGSAKMRAVSRIVDEVLRSQEAAEPDKVLIFSAFTSALYLARDMIQYQFPGARVDILAGGVSGAAREHIIRSFGTERTFQILLINYSTGAQGINLQAANRVVCLEPWWNPTYEAQALRRADRLGQHRPVLCERLEATGTLEERINAMAASKGSLMEALQSGDWTQVIPRPSLDRYELGRMITRSWEQDMTEADRQYITELSQQE